MKRVVLLGGGPAHAHLLQVLATQPMPGAQVTLVHPFRTALSAGMLGGLVAGRIEPSACSIPLATLAARAHVTQLEGQPSGLDAAARRVLVSRADGAAEALDYDTLSIDTDAVIDRGAIPGAREHALFIRPAELFVQLLDRLLAHVQEKPRSVVVIGAGAAAVELSLALARRIGGAGHVSLVTGGVMPLAEHPASAQRRAARALKRAGVTVFEEPCREISASHVALGGGARLACDAPVVALEGGPPAWLAASGLALEETGCVATGPTLQSRSHPEVFAAGAAAAAAGLALNLRRFCAGGALDRYQPRQRTLTFIGCGDGHAIGIWRGWSFEGRWVGVWKDRIERAFVARFRPGT